MLFSDLTKQEFVILLVAEDFNSFVEHLIVCLNLIKEYFYCLYSKNVVPIMDAELCFQIWQKKSIYIAYIWSFSRCSPCLNFTKKYLYCSWSSTLVTSLVTALSFRIWQKTQKVVLLPIVEHFSTNVGRCIIYFWILTFILLINQFLF